MSNESEKLLTGQSVVEELNNILGGLQRLVIEFESAIELASSRYALGHAAFLNRWLNEVDVELGQIVIAAESVRVRLLRSVK